MTARCVETASEEYRRLEDDEYRAQRELQRHCHAATLRMLRKAGNTIRGRADTGQIVPGGES